MAKYVRTMLAALGLAVFVAEAALAGQFYNPSHFNRTRQRMSNRAAARRIARKRTRKVVKKTRSKRVIKATAKRQR